MKVKWNEVKTVTMSCHSFLSQWTKPWIMEKKTHETSRPDIWLATWNESNSTSWTRFSATFPSLQGFSSKKGRHQLDNIHLATDQWRIPFEIHSKWMRIFWKLAPLPRRRGIQVDGAEWMTTFTFVGFIRCGSAVTICTVDTGSSSLSSRDMTVMKMRSHCEQFPRLVIPAGLLVRRFSFSTDQPLCLAF